MFSASIHEAGSLTQEVLESSAQLLSLSAASSESAGALMGKVALSPRLTSLSFLLVRNFGSILPADVLDRCCLYFAQLF